MDAATQPLIRASWMKEISILDVLRDFGYVEEAKELQSFAKTIQAINGLKTFAGTDGWVDLGGFTATASSSTSPLSIAKFAIDPKATDNIAQQLSSITDALRSLTNIPGLSISLDNPQELLKLLAGESTDLFSYSMNFAAQVQNFNQLLASIPVFPVALTSVDLSVGGGIELQAGATFGFDSSGFESGRVSDGFYVSNSKLSGNVNFGLSGTLNLSYVIGYRATGAIQGTVSVEMQGGESGKIYLIKSGGSETSLAVKNSVTNGITTKPVGTEEMLGQLAKIIGSLGKKAMNEIAAALSPENLNALCNRLNQTAGNFLSQLDNELLASKLGQLSAKNLSALVDELPGRRITAIFRSLDTRGMQNTIEKLNWRQVGEIAANLDGRQLTRLLDEISPNSMHALMNTLKGKDLINIAEELTSSTLGKALSKLDARQLKEIVRDANPRVVANGRHGPSVEQDLWRGGRHPRVQCQANGRHREPPGFGKHERIY